MYLIDTLLGSRREIMHVDKSTGEWAIARPERNPIVYRIKDAWKVLTGKAEAVYFVEDLQGDAKQRAFETIIGQSCDNI